MSRRVRLLVLAGIVLVVGVVVAAVVTVQPGLADARDRVDARWEPLREPLLPRYIALRGISQALHDAGAGERAAVTELDAALTRWEKLSLQGPKHADPEVEAKTANDLEALSRRVRADVTASARLAPNPAITAAFQAYDQALITPPVINAYNRAVRAYEDEREGTVSRLVANALGFSARPQLELGV